MKILYIAKKRSDAELTVAALRGLTPNLTLLWLARFDQAEKWIDEHPDVGALLVDADVDDQGCARFLMHVRRRGVNAPGVVIASEGSFALAESLHAGADDYVAKNQAIWRDLPPVVARAMARARALGAKRWNHLRLNSAPAAPAKPVVPAPEKAELHRLTVNRVSELENKFAEAQEKLHQSEIQRAALIAKGDSLAERVASLDELRQSHSSALERIDQLTAREAALIAELADTTAARSAADARLAEAARRVEAAETRETRSHLLASERRATLESQLSAETVRRQTTDRELADVRRSAANAEQMLRGERTAYAEHLAELNEQVKRTRQTAEADIRKFSAERTLAQHELGQALTAFQQTLDRVSAEHTEALASLASERTGLQSQIEALQERLGQAQRMETVGRLASEVVVRCVTLLDDVHRNAARWLQQVGCGTVRQEGEMLLEEIERTAGFLRQLAPDGNEETSAQLPVELTKSRNPRTTRSIASQTNSQVFAA